MNKLQHTLLASACLALVGVAGMATSASATTCNGDTNCSLGTVPYTFGANDVFGAGSSLIAPYWRQSADCYGNPADLVTKGSPPTFVDEKLFDYTFTPPQNCATTQINTSTTTWYISTGSGSGILGVFSHDPKTFWGPVNEASGNQYFPEVFYGNSDAGLGSTDVTAYNSGDSAYCQGSTCINIAAPNALQCNGEQSGQYPNPAQCYGPLVQFPLSIDPIAIFYTNGGIYEKIYDGTTKKEIDYKLNVQNGNKYGGLRLSVNSLCGIYNGEITNWNDPSLTADNNGVPLVDPKDPSKTGWSVPLVAVARSDSSGTTSIQTRHLANICANYPGNLYTTGATTIANAGAGSLVGTTYNVSNPNYPGVDQSGKLTMAPNSSGVAQYVAFTQAPAGETNLCSNVTVLPSGYTDCIQQSRVGYVGADYVVPYVAQSQTNSYQLYSAALENENGQYVAVSPKTALIAFGSLAAPQTNSRGQYCSSCNNGLGSGMRNDPTAWVEGLSATGPLANPTASGAYPDVGTTNMITYSCFADATTLANLVGQINYQETAKINSNKKGVLGSAGLSPLPPEWTKAIDDAFITNRDKLGLQLSVAGSHGTAQCQSASGA